MRTPATLRVTPQRLSRRNKKPLSRRRCGTSACASSVSAPGEHSDGAAARALKKVVDVAQRPIKWLKNTGVSSDIALIVGACGISLTLLAGRALQQQVRRPPPTAPPPATYTSTFNGGGKRTDNKKRLLWTRITESGSSSLVMGDRNSLAQVPY